MSFSFKRKGGIGKFALIFLLFLSRRKVNNELFFQKKKWHIDFSRKK